MIPRYSRPDMVALWSPETRFRIWFEIEAHACDAQAKLADQAPTELFASDLREVLAAYGEIVGAAFQLSDDILVGLGGGYGNDLSRIGTAAQVRGTSTIYAAYASIQPASGTFIDGMVGRGQLVMHILRNGKRRQAEQDHDHRQRDQPAEQHC